MKWILHILVAFAFAPFFPAPAYAQLLGDPVGIRITPEAPSPGERTLVTITSFPPLDLGLADIRWSVNGAPAVSGVGVSTFLFTMGPAGEETAVGVSITQPGIPVIERTLRFSPGSVELVWEADTYVPPFYAGRSAYTPGANITVLAIPDVRDTQGRRIDASSLTFRWERNEEPVQSASGRGKEALSFRGNQLYEEERVTVRVLRPDGSLAARKDAAILAREPQVLLYERDPLRGVRYERAIPGSFSLSGQEATFVAEPYFFSAPARDSQLISFSWTLNGKEVDPATDAAGQITLRREEESAGRALLALQVQHLTPARILQAAGTALQLVFGNERQGFFSR